MSKPVISTDSCPIRSEFRNGIFGIQLWIEEECQDWDTNTGMETGREYYRWRKATKAEREHFVRNQK